MRWTLETNLLTSASFTPIVEEFDGRGGYTDFATYGFRLGVDGEAVGTAGLNSLQLWTTADLDSSVDARTCALAGRNLTLAEWTRYVQTELLEYRTTCPKYPNG